MPQGLGSIAAELKKKSNDPKPNLEEIELRKVFLNVVKGPKKNKTFWVEKMDKLYKHEDKIKIKWDALQEDFKDNSKKKQKDENDPKKVKKDKYDDVIPSDSRTRVEIQLSKFSLGIEEIKKGLVDMKLGFDQITQISHILPSQEVIL